ncbi:DUF2249 domain-containing protein [Rhodoblastus sp.]|mgnify:CR=1 FL=1|jgi:uncharacterized protein (DUF2249 family)|uniref:DUF2249 domain-containing protein n=1 Tax=Rhodoblastus sp. TaxID=1962975 RepID=UPI0025F9EF2D|nr:DUF2249 domain-containing protein [Rhodoblastus sp.]
MLDRDRNERVIKVADIAPQYRHKVTFQLFERLDPEQLLQLVVDHDPRPLRLQLEARRGERCDWMFLEARPDVWRVRLQLRKCGAGRSCGSSQKSFSPPPQHA